MARALLRDSTVLCKGARRCRFRARASFRRHKQASARNEGNPGAFYAVDWPVKGLTSARSRPREQCSAGLTASHEDTKASDHSGTERTVTEEMFSRAERYASSAGPAGGAGGNPTYAALQGADAAWSKVKGQEKGKPPGPCPDFVQEVQTPLDQALQYDVIMCGGTLGIFLACCLQLRGLRVAVVERGPLQGRQQEWNISRKELQELVHEELLTSEEADECISIEFNPVRAGFHGSHDHDVWTEDVLNLGVKPDKLIDKMRHKFEAAGGKVLERTMAQGVRIHPDGVALQLQSDQPDVTGQLLIDCMGNFSPIVRQARWGQKPDGVCMVVGSCCRGFHENNTTGDVIYTNSSIQPPDSVLPNLQCFWEAFPSGSGPADRTTYMFTYIDAQPTRPSLLTMMEEYWKRMPVYQGISLDQIEPLRILFGWFPTYKDSPLKTPFDRVLQIGDASGIQSPLSFGGFGAMARHLSRLRRAVQEALQVCCIMPTFVKIVPVHRMQHTKQEESVETAPVQLKMCSNYVVVLMPAVERQHVWSMFSAWCTCQSLVQRAHLVAIMWQVTANGSHRLCLD